MLSHESSFVARQVLINAAAILLIISYSSLFNHPFARAYGQTSTATLSGTVIDEAGAVIPEVKITLLNLSTALQRHDTTNADGSYVVPFLPPGRYNVTAQRDGFTTVEIRNVVLNTGDQLALRIKLKIGEIGESVIIVEEHSSMQESVSIGTVVNRRFVENLPLNGRSFQTLFQLAPGVVLTRASFDEQGQFSVNGQRGNANYFLVDGVSANFGVSAGSAPGQSAGGSLPALTALGTTSNLISIEALEEFRILTSAYAPEFGRVPGAQISLITRSGSNEFHGTIYDYFRNDALDANDWFANSRGLKVCKRLLHTLGRIRLTTHPATPSRGYVESLFPVYASLSQPEIVVRRTSTFATPGQRLLPITSFRRVCRPSQIPYLKIGLSTSSCVLEQQPL